MDRRAVDARFPGRTAGRAVKRRQWLTAAAAAPVWAIAEVIRSATSWSLSWAGRYSAMTAASAVSLAAISSRPASANALAASRRFLASVERIPTMSSSESSRDCLPATSALATAVSTIRRVEERTSSRLLMAAVRSARRWSFSSLMRPIVPGVAALRG